MTSATIDTRDSFIQADYSIYIHHSLHLTTSYPIECCPDGDWFLVCEDHPQLESLTKYNYGGYSNALMLGDLAEVMKITNNTGSYLGEWEQ